MIICEDCGQETADTPYCVRCGHRRGRAPVAAARRGFSANPTEAALSLRIISTIFPQLPRDEMRAFRWALLLGTAIVVVLGAVGAFPVALVAAAVLVPLVMVVYLYDVDIYEDEPLRIYVFTFVSGAILGALTGLVLRAAVHQNVLSGGYDATSIAVLGVAVPLVSGALMLIGPIVLLRYPRFNDMLDGATFGATAAAAFVGAQIIAQSIDLLRDGLFPTADRALWVARLLAQGVALPLIAGGAVGAACGALWLHYRAPSRDRSRLGRLGHPAVALASGGLLLVLAALSRLLLAEIPALIAQVILAAIALIWLRLVLHGGLIEESLEIPIGPDIICPYCGKATPFHTFCGECGVALRALPKARLRPAAAPDTSAPATPATGGGPEA